MRGDAAAAADVLRSAVWSGPLDASSAWDRVLARAEGPGELAAAARYHRVEGYLLEWVRSVGGHRQLERLLRERLDVCVRQHLSAVAALRRLGGPLDLAGVPWVTFKGPVLAETAHGSASRRSYNDLDVLVPRGHFARAVRTLAEHRVNVLDTNTGHLLEMGAGQLHLRDAWGQNIDLHWGILYGRRMRDAYRMQEEGLLRRRRWVQVVGHSVPTFGVIDTLLHLGLHGALGGAHRLVWLKDVERVIAVEQPSWVDVVAAAHAARVATPLAVVLRRVRAATGAAVPGEVLRALAPTDLRLLDAAMVHAYDPAASDAHGSPARLVARSSRGTAAATRRELLRRLVAVRPAAVRGGRDDRTMAGEGHEAFDPDRRSRPMRDYLDWVDSGTPVADITG